MGFLGVGMIGGGGVKYEFFCTVADTLISESGLKYNKRNNTVTV